MTLSTQNERPNCTVCNVYECKRNGISKQGFQLWKNVCSRCSRVKHESAYAYKVHKGSNCSLCGFIPVVPRQLDVDHSDGDHTNNSPDNLKTLCANCHRLKTYESKDWRRAVHRYNK